MNAWRGFRRPLLVAAVLGCASSLMTSGQLSLRLAASSSVCWTFVPLCQMASLALLRRRAKLPFQVLVDEYFRSNTGWLLWVVAFAAVWAFVPAPVVFSWTHVKLYWYGSAAAIFAWAAWLDFGFLRRATERTPAQAARDLAIQRLVSWAAGMAIFVGPGAWQVIASKLGL